MAIRARWCAAMLLLAGCGPKDLTKEVAEQMLSQEIAEAGGATCRWSGVVRYSDTTWAFLSYERPAVACAAALQSAGLVTLGECVDAASGDRCFKRKIQPTGKGGSKMSEKTNELLFDCGTVQFKQVVQLTQKDGAATVRYARDLVLDQKVLAPLEACVLAKPEPGEKERERAFRRDTEGRWAIVP
jgi:hypothetical protein